MLSQPQVTIIIPAYNAEKYLREAVDSVILQSYSDWKMIIIDDCSSDSTLKIAEEYAASDHRIRVIRMESQSGGAYLPRKRAILEADTPFVAPLDADDTLSPDYLEGLMSRFEEAEVDAVYPTIYSVNNGEMDVYQTAGSPFIGQTLTGREALTATLDGWRIQCGGGIIRKTIYLETFETLSDREIKIKSYLDEYLTRLLLFHCRKVAITGERYIYRDNPDSITHSNDIRAFGRLENDLRLIPFVKRYYGEESEAYIRINRQTFHGVADGVKLLNKVILTPDERKAMVRMLEKSRDAIDFGVLKGKVSGKYRILLSLPLSLSRYIIRIYDWLNP